uniref:Integrase n=1 Tax=Gongylonema pulchrum TaxID=637853 RepID=A0A183EXI4_9BILA
LRREVVHWGMPKLDLGLDDESDGGEQLQINRAYADRYNNWRRLEELQKCKIAFLQ